MTCDYHQQILGKTGKEESMCKNVNRITFHTSYIPFVGGSQQWKVSVKNSYRGAGAAAH